MQRALAVAVSVCLTSAFARAAIAEVPAAPGLMTIRRLEGSATGSAPGRDRDLPLLQGEKLSEGTTVQTAADSRMEIVFGSGTILRLGEKTKLTLRDAPEGGGQFHARLWVGNFWAHVHKLLASERFELETENAVAGVPGTSFRVEVKEGKPDLLLVYEGVVEVDGKLTSYGHRVVRGRELRFAREAGEGAHVFDAVADAKEGFMQWVNAREAEGKSAPDKSDKRERTRDRLRHLLRNE